MFDELTIHNENPMEAIDEFIDSEIMDFEVYLEAIKTQKDFLGQKKRMRLRLDMQLEKYGSMAQGDQIESKKLEKAAQDLEQVRY